MPQPAGREKPENGRSALASSAYDAGRADASFARQRAISAAQCGRNSRPDLVRKRRRRVLDLLDELLEFARVKRRSAREQIKETRAHRVDVRAHVERFTAKLFRRRVLRRALESLAADLPFARARRNRQAEVTDLHAAVDINEAVRRLDVAMQNARRRRGIESANHIKNGRDRLGGGHRTALNDAVFECAAWQQLHRDHGHAVDLFAAENVDGMRMTDGRREAAFAQEPRAVLVQDHLPAQQFQCDAAAGLGVHRFVHLAHAAMAEQLDDRVRPELLARNEPLPFTGRPRRRHRPRRQHRRVVAEGRHCGRVVRRHHGAVVTQRRGVILRENRQVFRFRKAGLIVHVRPELL